MFNNITDLSHKYFTVRLLIFILLLFLLAVAGHSTHYHKLVSTLFKRSVFGSFCHTLLTNVKLLHCPARGSYHQRDDQSTWCRAEACEDWWPNTLLYCNFSFYFGFFPFLFTFWGCKFSLVPCLVLLAVAWHGTHLHNLVSKLHRQLSTFSACSMSENYW